MKEQKNTDWKLFELLEKDLSAAEEAEILAKIESNEELEEEWSLLKQTRLVPPTVEYRHKNQLKKKETVLVHLAGMNWLKYAAAVAFIAVIYPIWKNYSVDTTTEISGVVRDKVAETEKSSEPQVALTEHTKEVPVTDDVKPEMQSPEALPEIQGSARKEITPSQSTRENKPKVEEVDYMVASNWVLPEIEPAAGQLTLTEAWTPYEALPLAASAYSIQDLIPMNEDATDEPLIGLRPMVDQGLNWVLAPFRNSRLQIHRADNNKALEIEYSSQQYHAVAMVSLRALKENK